MLSPGELGLHQAVHEDDDPGCRLRECIRDGVAIQRHRPARHPHRHRLRERAALLFECVAGQARDGPYHRRTGTRGRRECERLAGGMASRRVSVDRRAGGEAKGPGAQTEPRVHAARDPFVQRAHQRGTRAHGAEDACADRPLDLAYAAGEPRQLVEAERGQGAELAVAHERIPP
jgi:hypothetical protein